jgi:hypothetical protein
MECRVCLDTTPPFLENVCACRGTQGYIHKACLLSWIQIKPAGICDVCKQAFILPRPIMTLPFFHTLLFSNEFTSSIRTFMICMYFTPFFFLMIYIQYILFGAYTLSYVGLLGNVIQHSPRYIWLWLHPYLYLPSGQIIYPLGSLALFFLPTQFPLVWCLTCYQKIWYIHLGILQCLQDF